ncbi:MAG TPA: hypothetical protein VEZ11_18600, partial [Thermoanaerobaculia bacterium]|nr:hypothetical protein [Thermoanaerobaculia bacterium]
MTARPEALSICFVTAMYRNADCVRAFVAHLRSLPGAREVALHMIVANNGGEPAPEIPGAVVFDPGRNLGYVPGCAWALARWLELGHRMPEWICVSNTDLLLNDDFFLELSRVAIPEDAGVVAPDVRLGSGARQNPILWRRPARAMMFAYAALSRLALFMPIFEMSIHLRHKLRRAWAPRAPALVDAGQPPASSAAEAIYAAHGSIFLVHRRFFERGGALHYRGTMYGEEIHIAEQARRAGLRVLWLKSLGAEHQGHATTHAVSPLQRRQWYAESAGVLWSDYFDR